MLSIFKIIDPATDLTLLTVLEQRSACSIKNQASDFQNVIYVVTATGSTGAVFVLTRAIDFDHASDIQTGDSSCKVMLTWDFPVLLKMRQKR